MITMDTGARSGIMRAKMPSPAADYNEALSHVSHDVLSSLRRVLASYRSLGLMSRYLDICCQRRPGKGDLDKTELRY